MAVGLLAIMHEQPIRGTPRAHERVRRVEMTRRATACFVALVNSHTIAVIASWWLRTVVEPATLTSPCACTRPFYLPL